MIHPDRFRLRIGAALITAALLSSLAGAGGGLPVVATFPDGGVVRGDFLQPSSGVNTLTFELPVVPDGAAVHVRLTGPAGQVIDVPLTALPAEEAGGDAHGGHAEASAGPGHVEPAEHAAPASDQTHTQATPVHPAEPHANQPGAHADDPAAHTDEALTHQEDAHVSGPEADPHEAATVTPAPETTQDAHGAAPDAHDTAEGTDDHAHGPAAGYRGWTRVRLTPGRWTLEARMDDMPGHTLGTDFTVVPGGPSPLFTGTAGLLMLGFTGFGFVHRRFPHRKGNKVTSA